MQSIGERLEEARKRKGVTIREAAEATKIRGDYLNSFENNNFSINVPDIYVRGFLRSYCNFLKLNSEKVITDFNANLIGEAKAAKREHREFFGRMELQQPLVTEEAKPAATIVDTPADEQEEKEDKGSFLQNIEKEVAIKIGIIAIVALLLILVMIWVFRALTSGGADDVNASTNSTQMVPTQSSQSAQSPAESKSITLIATGDVRVTVTERSTGRVILDNHPMFAGQREPVEIFDSVRIEYNEGANLNVEINGTAYGTQKTGPGYSTIDKNKI